MIKIDDLDFDNSNSDRHLVAKFDHPTLPDFSLTWRTPVYIRHPKRIIDEIRSFFYQFKYMYQRARYGYSELDWWSTDLYILSWLPEAVRKYKYSMGWPGEGALMPDGRRMKTVEDWHAILETIASGLEDGYKDRMLIDYDPGNWQQQTLERIKRFDHAFELLHFYWWYLWD